MKLKFDYTFRALGSLFVISVFREDDRGLDAFVQSVRNNIADFESEFSRFVPDSSLSVLNRLRRLEVSDRFLDLVRISKECHARSQGFFNPLYNVALLGYSRDFESGVFVPEIPDVPVRTDFENVSVAGREIVLSEGMKLDFWAIGKGYLADIVSRDFENSGFHDAVLNFWGDIYALWSPSDGSAHRIGIASPFEEGGVFATIEISNASVSSSWTYLRKWKVGEDEYRHIVFPGYVAPGDQCAGVTVVDRSAGVSDAFATALFAAWMEKWYEIAVSAGIDALFVRTDRKITATPGFAQKYRLAS